MKKHTILNAILAFSVLLSIGIASYLHGIYLGLCITFLYALAFASVFYTVKRKQRKESDKNGNDNELDVSLLYTAFLRYKERLLNSELYEDCILADAILKDLKNGITPPEVFCYDIKFLNVMLFKHSKSGVELETIKAYEIVGKKESVV
jgi:hypothetical protein